jgi:hypothetical protein
LLGRRRSGKRGIKLDEKKDEKDKERERDYKDCGMED